MHHPANRHAFHRSYAHTRLPLLRLTCRYLASPVRHAILCLYTLRTLPAAPNAQTHACIQYILPLFAIYHISIIGTPRECPSHTAISPPSSSASTLNLPTPNQSEHTIDSCYFDLRLQPPYAALKSLYSSRHQTSYHMSSPRIVAPTLLSLYEPYTSYHSNHTNDNPNSHGSNNDLITFSNNNTYNLYVINNTIVDNITQ